MRRIEDFLNRPMDRRQAIRTAIEVTAVAAVGGGIISDQVISIKHAQASQDLRSLDLINGCPPELTQDECRAIGEVTYDESIIYSRTGNPERAGISPVQKDALDKYGRLYSQKDDRVDFYSNAQDWALHVLAGGATALATLKGMELFERRKNRMKDRQI